MQLKQLMEIADAIMISNHGGAPVDGSRSPFDQLDEIVNAVGGKIDIIYGGGIRGTHILKALSKGANACSGGGYIFMPKWRRGDMTIDNLKSELTRNSKLMGFTKISQLSKR